MSAVPTSRIFSTALIITGNMVGAGILALPINLGPAGLIPSLLVCLGMWVLMLYTGLVIAKQPFLAENPDADLPTFFEDVLGPLGKKLSVAANLVLYYGLLVAYLAGVASVLVNTFDLGVPQWVALLGYFAVGSLMVSFGEGVMRRSNMLLMLIMWGTFAALVFMVIPHASTATDRATDWQFVPATLPILVAAFNFHNIIPVACRALDHDQHAIRKAFVLGSGIGMIMTVLWATVVIMALPMTGEAGVSIISAFKQNLPATVPLERLITNTLFRDVALVFAVVAMSTSFIACGVGAQSFMRDLFSDTRFDRKLFAWLAAFVPPVFVGVVYPQIFLKALDIVGGVGIGTLFGILPGIVLVKQGKTGSKTWIIGWLLIFAFIGVLGIEVLQETSMLHINPDVEYWTHVLKHK